MVNTEIVMPSAQVQETSNLASDRQDRTTRFSAIMPFAALKLNMGLKPSKIKEAILKAPEGSTLYQVHTYPITNHRTFHSLHVFQTWV